MELKLKTVGHNFYEPITAASFFCETMREHIVPDSCADIARIVETTGQVFVTGREIGADGRFCASGNIDVSVLYIPEKGDGPCALRFRMPFQSCVDGGWDPNGEFPDVSGELRSIETRLLNPRKVLTRANVELHPIGCSRASLTICTDSEDDESIQFLSERRESGVIATVREREFSFEEEMPISPGRSGAEEIVSSRFDIRATDCKLIGNKLVVKGIVAATVMYREDGNRLEFVRNELPFSQILDGSGIEEDWENESVFRLLNAECVIGSEGGSGDRHTITVKLLLRCRVTVWRNEEIRFIADLYSTASPVLVDTEEIVLREDVRRYTRRQNLRHILETSSAVKTVLDAEAGCGAIQQGESGDSFEIPVWVRCLYLDENDALHSLRREFTAVCPKEQHEQHRMDGLAACRGDVMVSVLPDGIEIRFPVDCFLETWQQKRYVCVSGGKTEEEETAASRCPSVILRKIGPDEKLWTVAKQYRTTCRAILEANEISDERQFPCDRMLLIPRHR